MVNYSKTKLKIITIWIRQYKLINYNQKLEMSKTTQEIAKSNKER